MRIKTLLLLPLLLGLTLSVQATAKPKLYHGVGVVDDIEKNGQVLVIEHEAIPGLMDAMTMPFELADVKLAKGIKIGDHIRFTLVQKDHFWPIIALEKFKTDTSHKKHAAASSPATRPTAGRTPMNMPL